MELTGINWNQALATAVLVLLLPMAFSAVIWIIYHSLRTVGDMNPRQAVRDFFTGKLRF